MSRIWKCLAAFLVATLLLTGLASTAGCANSQPKWRLQKALPRTADFHGVWGSSSSDVFVVGLDGVILHYDGKAWSEMESGTTEPLHGVWGSSPADVFAVGESGTILHYDGTAWSATENPPVSADLLAIWGSSARDVYAVGALGIALHFDGAKWTSDTGALKAASSTVRDSTLVVSFYGVWGSSPTDVFLVGSAASGSKMEVRENLIMHYRGTTWVRETTNADPLCDALCGIWGSSAYDVRAVGPHPTVSSSNFMCYDGRNWRAYDGDLSGRRLKYLIFPPSLNAIWGSSAQDVFVVGDSGVVLHDNGKEWKIMTSPAKVTLNGLWGSSSRDVFAVGAGGTVLHYS